MMKQYPLFPRYFRWVALALVVLAVALIISLSGHVQDFRKEVNIIAINLINSALFIYFFTRRKIDDEMFVDIRFKTVIGGIVFMIIGVFTNSIWNIIDPSNIKDKGAASVLLEGMIFITFIYELLYQKMKNRVDEE